jgi:protein-S-isoprenylcysteine O-methyltransferase Ste14
MFHHDPVGWPGIALLAIGFVAFLGMLFAARLRARKTTAAATRGRRNASWLWIGVQGIGIASAAVGPIKIDLDPLSPKALGEAVAVLLLMGGGVALFDWATRTMGKTWALVARTRVDHELVQGGPFAYVRNPIYVALFGFMLAMAIAYGHVASLIFAVPLFALGTWLRVRHEEALLRAMFGAEYDAYAARVSRFVPGVF